MRLQLKDLHNMEKRTLMHWGREFNTGISAGGDYKDLPKVITINMDSAIHKAYERLNFVTQDKEFLRNYHLRLMAMSDRTTEVNTATEKGIEKGIEIGIEKGAMQNKIEVAKNSLSKGLSMELIHEITGLDIEIIQTLSVGQV